MSRPVADPTKGEARPASADLTVNELGFDEALFAKLKKLRNALAKSEGVPAYRVFSDQTLEFITRLKPRTLADALKIRGVGEIKAREFMPDFLAAVRQHDGGKKR